MVLRSGSRVPLEPAGKAPFHPDNFSLIMQSLSLECIHKIRVIALLPLLDWVLSARFGHSSTARGLVPLLLRRWVWMGEALCSQG